jgi:DHA1 family bicyclomycin/chloramphenicol resistance-like MFS transporter
MSIDTMLPAIGTIAGDFGVIDPNRRQYIITSFFAGMTVGTLLFGPISDSTGRKPSIFAGLLIYLAGSALCLFSTSFEMMLAGRALQGFGAASPRIVSMAMVRDGQGGAAMARIMSFVMSVFMLVPILAPSIGQLVLFVASWRMIFAGFIGMALGFGLLLLPYLLGGMGAGDVKALAALGAWLGFWGTLFLFCYMAIAGGILAVATLWWTGQLWTKIRQGWIILFNWILCRT